MRKKRNTLVDILVLTAVTIVTYFPVSAFLFSLKNDSLVQYLPFRYHLSESIQHGYFPFWSPYLYTGFPIHADMQGMTWNPIVLVISLVTRYNMSILQFEVMIYLVLAAVGMYSLLRAFNVNRFICIVAGISYMSCGFINGSASVIPWISSAAFIPFVFKYLLLFCRTPSLRAALFFSGSLCLLFLCGYPTFFIYTCYIIFAILVYLFIGSYNKKPVVFNTKNIFFFISAVLIFLLVCSPAIISYWEFLPYYSRGSGITVSKAAENPFTLFSSISFILPNLVSKAHAWLDTDTSMRNSYVGCFVFLLFVISLFAKQNNWKRMILGITLFSFLLSLGEATPLHKICYNILPLFNTFRHPGNIRLFTSIGIILLAAYYAQHLLSLKWESIRKQFLVIAYVLAIILGLVAIYCILQPGIRKNLSVISKIRQPKLFMEWINFHSLLFIQCLLQFLFCIVLIVDLRRKLFPTRIIVPLFALNSILFCWIALPITFVSQLRTKSVNQYVRSFPDGYPKPDISAPAEANIISDSTRIPVYGYRNFYNKKITIQDHVITPTLNKDYESFFHASGLRKLMANYPLAWLNDSVLKELPASIDSSKKYSLAEQSLPSSPGVVSLIDFSPNRFIFSTDARGPAVLSVFQQYNHNWKVKVNGETVGLLKLNKAFIGVEVPGGKSEVEFVYRPAKVILAAWVSLIKILLMMVYLVFLNRKRKIEQEQTK